MPQPRARIFNQPPLLYVGTLCTGNERESEGRFTTAIYCGGGFMLLKREAVERMIAAYPETRYIGAHAYSNAKSDENYALFDCMIDKETGHIGAYNFSGDPRTRYSCENTLDRSILTGL